MKKALPPLLAVIFVMSTIAVISCSFGNPVTPAISDGNLSQTANAAQSPNRALIGYWTFHISADRQSITAVPEREAELHLNVTRLIEGKACNNCLQLGDPFVTSTDRLYIDLTLIHPYPGMLKYTGFDVRGVLMTGSDFTFPASGRSISWTGEHIQLLYPDGYTNLFNPTEYPVTLPGPPALRYIPGHHAPGGDLSATLNAYNSFRKDVERRMFLPDESETQTIYLQLVPGDLEFGYAIDACWAQVLPDVVEPLIDFPTSANCREAYVIFPQQGKGLRPELGTSAYYQVEVWDHQGIDTISTVTIEAPDIFNGVQALTPSVTTDEGIIFSGTITNDLVIEEGIYPLLVRVIEWDQDENLGAIDGWQVDSIRISESGTPISDLIYIPSGDFYMGRDKSNDPFETDPYPDLPGHVHPVEFPYYISKNEITYGDYGSFVADGGYYNSEWWSEEGWQWRIDHDVTHPKMLWNWYICGEVPSKKPIGVYYYEAEAFCNWAGGRIPSEAEWEKAARGDQDHRVFPWGDVWDPARVACNDNPLISNHEFTSAMPVGSFSPEGDSPYGLSDCSGNVSEWTSDWFVWDIYQQYALGNFTPPPHPDQDQPWNKQFMGGGFAAFWQQCRCAHRAASDIQDFNAESGAGFRICLDAD